MYKATKNLETIERGWSLQLYSSDRRLICAFDPSHGWVLTAGIALGFCIATIGFRAPMTKHDLPSSSIPMNAPLMLD